VTATCIVYTEQAYRMSRGLAHGWTLLVALTYGATLALMPGEGLLDRENYLTYLDIAPILILDWTNAEILKILSNEPLWILINAGIGQFFPREQSLQILIFVPAVIVAYCTLRFDRRYALILFIFLLLPQILKNHVVHLRQGFGIAIFLVGWFARSPQWRWGFWFLTPLLHSSFFFVILMLCISRVCQYWRLVLPVTWTGFLLAGLLGAFGLEQIARTMGARQSAESVITSTVDVSGLGFLLWLLALMLLLVQTNSFKRAHSFEIGTVLFYLATYFLSPFSARVFESTLSVVLLAGLRMRGLGRTIFLATMVAFGAFQWLMIYQGGGVFFEN
jgi:hypothetical protein